MTNSCQLTEDPAEIVLLCSLKLISLKFGLTTIPSKISGNTTLVPSPITSTGKFLFFTNLCNSIKSFLSVSSMK